MLPPKQEIENPNSVELTALLTAIDGIATSNFVQIII
jgi:hypothetical protein